jgi:membrane protease YdiL (CAAX protease family)
VSNGVEQPANSITVLDAVIVLSGVALFARWLQSTSLGRDALAYSKPRRNRMAFYLPFAMLVLWFLLQLTALAVGDGRSWQGLFQRNLVGCVASLVTIGLILVIAKLDFARGIKGLGLRRKTIPRDLGFAFLTLLAVWPLVLAAMGLTILITRMWYGQQYQIPQHEALKLLSESGAIPLRVLLTIMAVAVAPVVEEMLFRGLFQTTIRSYVQRPWPAIVITSLLFASIHEDVSHWPSLFVLALGLGYVYEKSGSLLRSIFMHALFNGINIALVLTQPPGLIS